MRLDDAQQDDLAMSGNDPFPWRVIPTAMTGLAGALLATSIVPLTYVVLWHPVFHGEEVPRTVIKLLAGCALAGLALLVAAPAWWKRRWLWAVGMTIAGYLVLIFSVPDR